MNEEVSTAMVRVLWVHRWAQQKSVVSQEHELRNRILSYGTAAFGFGVESSARNADVAAYQREKLLRHVQRMVEQAAPTKAQIDAAIRERVQAARTIGASGEVFTSFDQPSKSYGGWIPEAFVLRTLGVE